MKKFLSIVLCSMSSAYGAEHVQLSGCSEISNDEVIIYTTHIRMPAFEILRERLKAQGLENFVETKFVKNNAQAYCAPCHLFARLRDELGNDLEGKPRRLSILGCFLQDTAGAIEAVDKFDTYWPRRKRHE